MARRGRLSAAAKPNRACPRRWRIVLGGASLLAAVGAGPSALGASTLGVSEAPPAAAIHVRPAVDRLTADSAEIKLEEIRAAGGRYRVGEPVEVTIDVANDAATPAIRLRIELVGGLRGVPPATLASTTVDVAPGRSREAELLWTPDAAGTWSIAGSTAGNTLSAPFVIEVAPEPNADLESVVGSQQLPIGLAASTVILLVVASLLAARSALRLFGR